MIFTRLRDKQRLAMTRLLMGVAALLVGTAAGFYLSLKLKRRTAELDQLERLIDTLMVKIRFSHTQTVRLIEELAESEAYPNLDFLELTLERCSQGEEFPLAWKKAVSESNTAINDEEKELALSIGTFLGKSDVEGQLALLAAQKQAVSARLKLARDEYQRKAPMYRSVSALVGAGAGIILL